MKKVLILAYDFPPYISVGGLRPHAWFKYLSQFGIYPVVITRQWKTEFGNELDYISDGFSAEVIHEKFEYGEIIRTPYKPNLSNRILLRYGEYRFRFLRKLITGYFEFFQFIFQIGPKKNIYFGAFNYLKKNKVDSILATGDPFVLFKYASILSKKFNIPWIADYRDPWSQDIPIQKKYILKWWSNYNERKILRTVSAVTTVSQFVANKIAINYGSRKIDIIPNGFDAQLFKSISNINQNSTKLTISYAGTIYNWHPIEVFFNSVNEFLKLNSNVDLSLKFYGVNNQNAIKELLLKYPETKNCTSFYERIPNESLIKELAESNILLLFNYYSFMGTKIYDYLGLKRKILFCFTNDREALKLKEKYYNIDESSNMNTELQSDLIKTTQSGILVKNSNHLKDILMMLYLEFRETKSIQCQSSDVEKYSRELRVKDLADVILKNISSYDE